MSERTDEHEVLTAVAKAAEELIVNAVKRGKWPGRYEIRDEDHDRLWDALVAWRRVTGLPADERGGDVNP